MNSPRFPLYIVSKGRSAYMVTSKALTRMGVPHFVVVEPQEVEAYETAIRSMGLLATVLPLDLSFKDRYELCDDLGLSKSTLLRRNCGTHAEVLVQNTDYFVRTSLDQHSSVIVREF